MSAVLERVQAQAISVELQGGTLRLHVPEQSVGRVADLCGFASRQNPKRAFLFVSKVLGKHIPVKPTVMLRTHEELATGVLAQLGPDAALFLGFAETATGLGAGVYEACTRQRSAIGDLFVQTTRYQFNQPVALHFQEEHSHSTGHLLYEPTVRGELLRTASTVVLVDDELSTGKTSVNFIRALKALNPSLRKVVLVSLLNWMSPERRAAVAVELAGIEVGYVSLLDGAFTFEPRPGYVCPPMPNVDSRPSNKDALVPSSFGRFGHVGSFEAGSYQLAARLGLDKARPVHVVGDGEFMHPPFKFALALERMGFDAYFQSTTRSPILVGGAIGSCTRFADHYDDGIANFAYNLPAHPQAQLVLCHESLGPLSLLDQRAMQTLSFEELTCAQSC